MPYRWTPLIALAAIAAAMTAAAQGPNGESLYETYCAACHTEPQQQSIPPLETLRAMAPNDIVTALSEGKMRLQGQALSGTQQVAVAEYLAGRPVQAPAVAFDRGLCSAKPSLPRLGPGEIWNGWGPGVRNTRHQAATGGLVAGDVPKLGLAWAFGLPDVSQSRSQPTVVGGRLFLGSQSGAVYALDAETGCVHWVFEARGGVRTAISVGPTDTGYAIYFADAGARAYAVDAATGRELWSHDVDDHPAARATGSPTLYDGRLYVPVSGVSEETAAAMPDYECCTFRGSLTALDAATGAVVWKTYLVPEPEPRGKSSTGAQLWGPAGSPIWSAPTIDAKRGLVYAATGNAYADPDVGTSDAVVAFSMRTGEIEWVNQIMPDVWILGCDAQSTGGDSRAAENPNCPDDVGPDFDFSASPALVTSADGRDRLVITQKSGLGYALDPDAEGALLWTYRWGRGSPIGGVWGATSDGERAYFAVADQMQADAGGVHAVDLETGERVWFTPPQEPACAPGPGCGVAQSAALTSMPGIVFSGSADGAVRAYASETGEIVWRFDTNRRFETVNGIEARGGSIDGPGPVVAGGMLYVTAGNAGFVGTAGNVLLAFKVPD